MHAGRTHVALATVDAHRFVVLVEPVYTTCLHCDRPLGTNAELPHLPVGRRIAFDTTSGRLWVICRRCGQWNLTPIEERWEALIECDSLATTAEARAAGRSVGLAQTASGIELLRVGGMPNADIANWRYGRRLRARQRRLTIVLIVLAMLAAALGIGAARVSGSSLTGVLLGMVVGLFLFKVWRRPPRLPIHIAEGNGKRRTLWPWELQDVHFEVESDTAPPTLVIPHPRGTLRLHGHDAAVALAALLPKLNGADCADVSLTEVLTYVSKVEVRAAHPLPPPEKQRRNRGHSRRKEQGLPRPHDRPWEYLVRQSGIFWLTSASPSKRLALEIAVTEEIEQRAMAERADTLAAALPDEAAIGEIADTLLVPDAVTERLQQMRRRDSDRPDDDPNEPNVQS